MRSPVLSVAAPSAKSNQPTWLSIPKGVCKLLQDFPKGVCKLLQDQINQHGSLSQREYANFCKIKSTNMALYPKGSMQTSARSNQSTWLSIPKGVCKLLQDQIKKHGSLSQREYANFCKIKSTNMALSQREYPSARSNQPTWLSIPKEYANLQDQINQHGSLSQGSMQTSARSNQPTWLSIPKGVCKLLQDQINQHGSLSQRDVSTEFWGLDKFRAIISFDGTVQYNFPTVMEVQCQVDVTKFPFDQQTCPLQFGSWIYTGKQLDMNLQNNQADLSELKQNVEWDVAGALAVKTHKILRLLSRPIH
ncbi:CHRNN [Mytilus coruscus]|uniref:CHRNN n=1 Tax=Mytilus coruscus TaxID=42192 RepID=A0A6J8DMS0_MYTCO|nr:CHRNN [Mytilus coruscus]